MEEKLKPCPFCSCDKAQIAEEDGRHRPNVVCPICGVRVYGDTVHLAVLRWNIRMGDFPNVPNLGDITKVDGIMEGEQRC